MRFTGSLFLLLVTFCGDALSRDYVSHRYNKGILSIETTDTPLTIKYLSKYSAEVHYHPKGKSQLHSFSILPDLKPLEAALENNKEYLQLDSGVLQVAIKKSPFAISFSQNGEFLTKESEASVSSDESKDKSISFSFSLDSNEKILGAGERVLGMDRRGHRLPLDNKPNYGYSIYSEQMYFSLPVIMSSKKYMVMFDNTAKGFVDLGKTEKNTLQFEAISGRSSYVVVAGDTYPQLINHYVDITGKQPMPPRWALGNFASRFGYHTEAEAREMVERFKKEDFPLDAIILDLYWFGKDIKGHLGNLVWDKEAFPTPKKMIGDFKDKGVNTILITEPFVLSSSKRWDEAVEKEVLALDAEGKPKRFDFYFGNSGLIDVFNPKAQEWFWDIYKKIASYGAVGVWGDLGEPEAHPDDSVHQLENSMTARGDEIHNAFGHQWAKMVFARHEEEYPKRRPFIMMRSGFAGSQRYGMIPWTGDVDRSWNGLKPQVELSLQMGLFGLGYTHSDLGGFAGGEVFDKEMYIRWLQYGVFQPVYRPHAQEHIAPEPVMHDDETKNILRRYVKLRYQLLPYNYTLAFENATTGMPLMRPVFFTDESKPELIDRKDSYLWGDAFFVAPVVDPGVKQVKVKLPEGTWFDYWNGKKYSGGRLAKIPTNLETLPVLVKAGSFVPMVKPVATTKDYSSENLQLHYYADTSVTASEGQMYEDDGKTHRALEAGNYELLKYSAEQKKFRLTLELSRQENNGYKGIPNTRSLELVIHNWKRKPKGVVFAGDQITKTSAGDSYDYNADTNQLIIRVDWDHSTQQVVVQ